MAHARVAFDWPVGRAGVDYGGVRAGGVRGECARGNHSSTQGVDEPNDEVGGAEEPTGFTAPTPQANCHDLPVWLSSINHIAAGVPCPLAPGVPCAPAAGAACPPAAGAAGAPATGAPAVGSGPDRILNRSVGSAVCAAALRATAADSPTASNPAMTPFDHWRGVRINRVL